MSQYFGQVPWFVGEQPCKYVLTAEVQVNNSVDLKRGFPVIFRLKLDGTSNYLIRDEIEVCVNQGVLEQLAPNFREHDILGRPNEQLNRSVIRFGLSHAEGPGGKIQIDMSDNNIQTAPLFSPSSTSMLQRKILELFLLLYDFLPKKAISTYDLTLWFDTDKSVMDGIVNSLHDSNILTSGSIGDRVEWAGVGTHHYRLNPAKLNEATRLIGPETKTAESDVAARPSTPAPNRLGDPMGTKNIFIVHGHDKNVLNAVSLLLANQNIKPIVLETQANQGRTLIEKLEAHTDQDYAIVLLTPDDMGRSRRQRKWKGRARQNVILEYGYLMGKLGRNKVACLLVDPKKLEPPSDMVGLVYIKLDKYGEWKSELGRDLKAAGFAIDFEKLGE